MSERRSFRNDLIVLVILAAVIGGLFLLQRPWEREAGGVVIITRDGAELSRYPLNEDRLVPIVDENGTVTNTLQIQNGAAKMSDATCPDRLCVRQKAIRTDGETIVCLPHKVVVSIESGVASDLDAITR